MTRIALQMAKPGSSPHDGCAGARGSGRDFYTVCTGTEANVLLQFHLRLRKKCGADI